MITKNDLFKIGKLQKTHGIKGELMLVFDEISYADIDVDFYFFEIESTFVPFFIEEITFSDDTRARVKFEDIENEPKAAQFSNTDIYIHKQNIPETADNLIGWNYFIGYKVVDQQKNELGIIDRVDTSTINNLFILNQENEEVLIPATENFIVDTDHKNKIIFMDLPEGLLD